MGIVSNAMLLVSGAYLTLGMMYLRFWWAERSRRYYLAFAVTCLSYTLFSWLQIGAIRSQTPEENLFYGWWSFLAGTVGLFSIAWFVFLHLHGRKWLFVAYGALRIVVVILHLITANGVNFRRMPALGQVTILGETLSYPIVVASPWLVLPHLSHVLLIGFFLDASVRCWRRGERREALTFGTATILFGTEVLLTATNAIWGLVPMPSATAFAVLFIVAAMLYALNYDMHRSAMLGETLAERDGQLNESLDQLRERDARLTETLDQLQLSAAAANVGFWTRKVGEDEIWFSKKAAAVWGFTSGKQFNREDIFERIHPADRERYIANIQELEDWKNEYQIEYRFSSDDGKLRWIHSRGKVDTVDGCRIIRGAIVDVTDRKQSEEALKEANDELSKLKNQLEAENIYLQEELRQDHAFGDIVGQSKAIRSVLLKVGQVAPTDATVMITGETGTGKELVARAVHEASKRKGRPLIKVNCAALSPTLIESELFGHEKGSFTGAGARKLGRFEVANTGTLLLDEIGELPLDLQGKLLRVLQEEEFERVGGDKTIKVDVRILASTNRDLKQAVKKGIFREDLWYRLNVFPIATPPLRERPDDIPMLTEHFARTFARKLSKEVTAISPETMSAFCEYSWPGNVRELANVIERGVINLRGTVLKIQEDFATRTAAESAASFDTLEDLERQHILSVLENLNWRIDGPKGAARILGINPSTLRTRMGKLGISKADVLNQPTE